MGEPSAAVVRSLEDLRSVSSAVSKFIHTWDGLRRLLDSINSSMDSLSSQLDAGAASLPQASPSKSRSPHAEAVGSENEDDSDTDANTLSDEEDGSGEEAKLEEKPEPKPKGKCGGVPDIESICNSNSGKRLRKYVVDRLHSGFSQMYDEIPAALARTQDPAALVFGCLGGFYKQGKKTYVRKSPQTANRRASILVLEFFLLSGRVVTPDRLDPALRHQAKTAALTWKSRMLTEGGIIKAEDVDARGLLLLLASFGIPPQFRNDDIASLLMLSNPKKKSRVLRQSPILVPKLPEIIEDMVKDASHLAAAELVIAFELQEKFPLLPLLSSYLDAIKSVEAAEKNQGLFSAASMRVASEKRLSNFLNFLMDHDLYVEYESLKLDDIGSKLKKDVTNWLQKLNANKKTEETSPMERIEILARMPQIQNTTMEAEESPPLERIESHPNPQNQYGKRQEEIASMTGLEARSIPPQIVNSKIKAEETSPLERIESRPKQPPYQNAKRKAEEYNPFEIMEHHPKPPPQLHTNAASENPGSLHTWGHVSLGRPSLEHPNSVSAPMNMHVNGGGLPNMSPLGVAYPGMDSRFLGLANHAHVLPTGHNPSGYPESGLSMGGGYVLPTAHYSPENITSAYPENGLPISGGYTPPSAYHSSERYSLYRDSGSAGVPTTRHVFGISQPGRGSTEEYAGAYPEVRSLLAGPDGGNTSLPRGSGSRAPGSADRYNFADMV